MTLFLRWNYWIYVRNHFRVFMLNFALTKRYYVLSVKARQEKANMMIFMIIIINVVKILAVIVDVFEIRKIARNSCHTPHAKSFLVSHRISIVGQFECATKMCLPPNSIHRRWSQWRCMCIVCVLRHLSGFSLLAQVYRVVVIRRKAKVKDSEKRKFETCLAVLKIVRHC